MTMGNKGTLRMIRHRICITLLAVIALLCLCACAKQTPKPGNASAVLDETLAAAVNANNAIAKRLAKQDSHASVDEVLIPQARYAVPEVAKIKEHRFNLAVQDVPAKTFFTSLVKDTPYSVIVDPSVGGNISLNLKNVTIEDVLQAVRDTYGYGYRTTSYGFEVLPTGLQTRVFNVNYLNVARNGRTETSINSGQPSIIENGNNNGNNFNRANRNNNNALSAAALFRNNNNNNPNGNAQNNMNNTTASSSVTTQSQSDFWRELKETLKTLISKKKGHSFVVQPQAGIIVVRADATTLREVQDYLEIIQSNMKRSVILEAKILEVTLNDGFKSGVNWHLLGLQQGNQLNTSAPNEFTNIFTLRASARNAFDSFIKLLSEQGNVRTLSNPRISTLNNQKAVIKVGTDEYFVTGITSNTLANGNSAANTLQQNVNLTPFFSGIALDVTPQVDGKGNVILHIHPSISEVSQQSIEVKTGNGDEQNLKLPAAKSVVRESDSIVEAKNGQVIIIGGLMQNKAEETVEGTPFLGDLPFVGAAFRNTRQTAKKSELVILLRPIVVGMDTWAEQLRKERKHYSKLKRGFHFGNHPDVFGNEAEKTPAWAPAKYRN